MSMTSNCNNVAEKQQMSLSMVLELRVDNSGRSTTTDLSPLTSIWTMEVPQYDLFTRGLSCRTTVNVRQIQRVCRSPCPSSALEIGKISIRQDFLQRFMARIVSKAVNRHREILESQTRLFLLGAPTAVATQSGDNPTHAPTHTCRSRGGRTC